jgi:hypothetical protein
VIAQRFDFVGKLDGRTELGDGSVRFTARLTRIGVFDYGDHKELRIEDEVFKEASMASFRGLTVTDGHKAFVDPKNWKSVAMGHVGDDVRRDGDFLVASIVVKDAGMLKRIDDAKARGESTELSMGYVVNLDATPGRTDKGEEYDAIQRDIVGNHAALGPQDWGRAGSSVKLLDGAAYAPAEMTTPVLRTDAPINTDAADLVAARADAEAVRKERDAARADLAAANKRADSAEAERDAARKEATDAKAEAAKVKTDATEGADARIDARLELLDAARAVLPKDFVFKGKTDKEIRVAVITKVDPNVKLDGKSDGYLERSFELACESVGKDRSALGKTAEIVNDATGTPAKSVLDAAYEKADAERKAASEAGPPAGARVRK